MHSSCFTTPRMELLRLRPPTADDVVSALSVPPLPRPPPPPRVVMSAAAAVEERSRALDDGEARAEPPEVPLAYSGAELLRARRAFGVCVAVVDEAPGEEPQEACEDEMSARPRCIAISCRRSWSARWSLRAKCLPQSLHSNGFSPAARHSQQILCAHLNIFNTFSCTVYCVLFAVWRADGAPVCLRSWRVSSSRRANEARQPSTLHTYGRSPVWFRRCCFRCELFMYALWQPIDYNRMCD